MRKYSPCKSRKADREWRMQEATMYCTLEPVQSVLEQWSTCVGRLVYGTRDPLSRSARIRFWI
jgi:tRNA(Arg) A34 adenosine deaminase TadA